MDPLVSVCVVAYDQKDFIQQCLDSILGQQTNFEFEIIIGEDESTDGTREICMDYAKRFPEKIKLFLRSRKDVIIINGHPTARFNVIQNFAACKGRYIAVCEGDDYWTDPLKLQKQVDHLEKHDEFSVCFHRANVFRDGTFRLHPVPESANGSYDYNDLLSGHNFITSASLMFRNSLKEIPSWFLKVPYGDMGLLYLLTRNGKIACLTDTMSVYRIHSSGIWTGRKKMDAYMSEYQFYKIMYPIFKGIEHETLLKKARLIIDKIGEEKYPKNKLMRFIYKKKLINKLA